MLSSLHDFTGLFPGLFHRGQSAAAQDAAAGAAGRGQAQRAQVPAAHTDHSRHAHHGRDTLSLSPEAQAIDTTDNDNDGESVGDAVAAETNSQSLLGQAGGFVRQALETIRKDLAQALKSFGFDSDAIQNFSKAFVQPVIDALKDGGNFTAELSFAALSQVTAVSGSNVSQSTSLVAQKLEIEVNQDTGEVNVSLAKLSFEQQVQGTVGTDSGDGQQPLLVIDPDDLANPQDLAAKILASGESAATPPADSADAAPVETAAGETAPAEGGEETPADGEGAGDEDASSANALQQSLADLLDKLAEEGANFQTRLTIHSISTSKNDKGETVTKLLLDAQLKIDSLQTDANDATAQEEAQSLDLTA